MSNPPLPSPADGETAWIPDEHSSLISTWELVDEDGALEYTDQLAAITADDENTQASPGAAALFGYDSSEIPPWMAHQARRASEARMRVRDTNRDANETTPPVEVYGASRTDAAIAVQAGMVAEPTATDPAGGLSTGPARGFDDIIGGVGLIGAFGFTASIINVLSEQYLTALPFFVLFILCMYPVGERYFTYASAPERGPQLTDDLQRGHRDFTGGHHPDLAALMHQIHHATVTTDHGGTDDPLWDMWESLTALADEATSVPDNASRTRYDAACAQIVDEIREILTERTAEAAETAIGANGQDGILAELDADTAEIPASAQSQADLQSYLNEVTGRVHLQAEQARENTDNR